MCPMPVKTERILIVGSGYVGLYTTLRLRRRLRRELRRGEVTITVVDPQSYMTYQPFLPEAAAGNLEPRQVVAPLRHALRRVTVLNGRVIEVDHAVRLATVRLAGAEVLEDGIREVSYDRLVMAAGSISRTVAGGRGRLRGSVAGLGLHKGVAHVYGVRLRGILAWFVHRTYHLSRVPTVNRKARVTADWTLALFFPREIVSLGELRRPRQEFELATGEDRTT